jgi:hypothetical protein
MDQQGSSFTDDFVLKNEMFWRDGMIGQIIFKFKERMEPFTVAREDGYSASQHGKGWFLHFRYLLACQFRIATMDMLLRSSPYDVSNLLVF